MRPQQLLALCLLACVACQALAYEKEYEEKKEYYEKDYDYGKEVHEYEHYPKPECGPHSFKELKGHTCIKPWTGECVLYDEKTCKEDSKTSWCKKVNKKWACKYELKSNGDVCRDKMGSCDLEDKCTGDSAKCENKYVEKDTVCRDWKEGPCVLASKCDGKKAYCPGKKYAPHGTPCADGDGDLYEEAYDEYGKVYTMAEGTEAEALARKHKWYKCSQRCYEGECQEFDKKWWKKDTVSKDKKHHKEEEKEYKKEDTTDYGKEPEKDYYEVDNTKDWYETKYDYDDSAKTKSHEKEYYCKKHKSSY